MTYLASEPLLFEDFAAEVGHAGAKRRLGNLRVMSDAGQADTLPALDVAGPRRTRMAGHAADAVRLIVAEPLLFEDFAAEVGHAGAKRRLGNLRVVPGAGPTDALALLHVARARCG